LIDERIVLSSGVSALMANPLAAVRESLTELVSTNTKRSLSETKEHRNSGTSSDLQRLV
jgi:hypothetical protein